jgi:hypothetical protein
MRCISPIVDVATGQNALSDIRIERRRRIIGNGMVLVTGLTRNNGAHERLICSHRFREGEGFDAVAGKALGRDGTPEILHHIGIADSVKTSIKACC